MSVAIFVIILLLIAYFFDLTARYTKIPSVLLLLVLGWFTKEIIVFFKIEVPNLTTILPDLGNIGLVLIVLEGALELEFNKSKFKMIRKSFFGAFSAMLIFSVVLAAVFYFLGFHSLKNNFANAIPLCVISSAIAIPSVKYLSKLRREYVIYESSFSDILGVLFFNFIILNEVINLKSFGIFLWQIIQMLMISVSATLILSFILSKINHHVKFIPIILNVILIYELGKYLHLPALIFILIFGLFLGNIDEFPDTKIVQFFKANELTKEVEGFRTLTNEATFLVRSLFFLVFGFTLNISDIANLNSLPWSVGIVGLIFIIRIIQLKLSKLSLKPLLFIAPRGLITILLFLSIAQSQRLALINISLIVQVIILSSLVMMFGLIFTKTFKTKELNQNNFEIEDLKINNMEL